MTNSFIHEMLSAPRDKNVLLLLFCFAAMTVFNTGAMKQSRGTCSTFKAFNLTYLHAEIVETIFVFLTLWRIATKQTRTDLGTCMYQTTDSLYRQPLEH